VEEFVNRVKGCTLILAVALTASAQSIALNGTISDAKGQPVSGAVVSLVRQNMKDTTGANGLYSLGAPTGTISGLSIPKNDVIAIRGGVLSIQLRESTPVQIKILDIRGHTLAKLMNGHVVAGEYQFKFLTKPLSNQILVISVTIDRRVSTFRHLPLRGNSQAAALSSAPSNGGERVLVNVPATVDTLRVIKPGFAPKSKAITSYQGTENITLDTLAYFSFFVTSMKALIELSKSQNGFGGNFSFGKTGPGAGLKGADSICSCIAERSMPGSSTKQWRAFLSVSADENGKQVNAIDRVGNGPWYDRKGRVVALTRADLLNTRPKNADPIIANDLPNENGYPNHKPDGITTEDNHHIVTGSKTDGTLMIGGSGATQNSTCADWTSTTASGKPRCGFSWPRPGGGGGGASHWISGFDCGGCVAGIQVTSANTGGNIIGASGGYGGFYCLALTP
jgi:hypothetical protein